MLKIITAPNNILSEESKPVQKIDGDVKSLVGEMTKALEAAKDPIGVGLAAPQVGKSLRIFIAKPSLKLPILTFINPKIINASPLIKRGSKKKKVKKLEGCLSLPNIWGDVQRMPEIILEYSNEQGRLHRKKFRGFLATIIQHEVDHLDGILFPKRVLEQKGTLYKSEKDEKGEDIFEELKI